MGAARRRKGIGAPGQTARGVGSSSEEGPQSDRRLRTAQCPQHRLLQGLPAPLLRACPAHQPSPASICDPPPRQGSLEVRQIDCRRALRRLQRRRRSLPVPLQPSNRISRRTPARSDRGLPRRSPPRRATSRLDQLHQAADALRSHRGATGGAARPETPLRTRDCRTRRVVPPRPASDGRDRRLRLCPPSRHAQPHLRASPARRLRLRSGAHRARRAALRRALVSVEGRGTRDTLDPERSGAAGQRRAEAHPRPHRARPRTCAQVHGRRGDPPGRRPGRSSCPRRLHRHENSRHRHETRARDWRTSQERGRSTLGAGKRPGRSGLHNRQALSPRADRGGLPVRTSGRVPAGRSEIRSGDTTARYFCAPPT